MFQEKGNYNTTHNFVPLFVVKDNMQKRDGAEDEREDPEEEGRKNAQEKEEKMGGVCPGLPSPSGVHLVTHPLHRAQYMTD